MKRLSTSIALVVAAVALALAVVATPFKGSYTGLATSPNNIHGNLTHLGSFTGAYNGNTGVLTLTAANGDNVYATISNFSEGSPSNGLTPYSENWTITGGTGRFVGSTGGATITGNFDVHGNFAATVSGTIKTANPLP